MNLYCWGKSGLQTCGMHGTTPFPGCRLDEHPMCYNVNRTQTEIFGTRTNQLFKKSSLFIPPVDIGLAKALVKAMKTILGLSMVPRCSVESVPGGARNTPCPTGTFKMSGASCYTNCKCRKPCPPAMEFCDRTTFCYNPHETTCAKIKESQAIAMISFVLNFIPSAGAIKSAIQGVRAAKNLGKAAVKAAMKKAVKDCAKDVRDNLLQSAIQNAGKYYAVNGKAMKAKYLEAILDSDVDEGNLVTEVVFESFAAHDELKSDIEDFAKKVDPTGISGVIDAFNAESCGNVSEPMKTVATNSAFDYLPLCMFEGASVGDCTHSNHQVTVR